MVWYVAIVLVQRVIMNVI